MTQERMIRVNKKEFEVLRGDNYADSEDIASMAMSKTFMEWDNLEPAPPKDWTPKCYYGISRENPMCVSEWRLDDDECNECIYRKKE